MSGTRPPANRMMLMQYKAKSVGAKKGHKLLKQKRDALKARFQQMLKEIIACKKSVGRELAQCWFSLAKTKYAAESDISASVIASITRPASTTSLKSENVAGVQLPKFTLHIDESKFSGSDSLGINCGGAVIQSTRDTHLECLKEFVKLASLQTSFITLDREIQMTSRRVNALEYVLIPRIEETVSWIKGEMDEQDREEFFRVKKVVDKKKIKVAAEREEEEKRLAKAAGGAGFAPPNRSGGGGSQGMGWQAPQLQTGKGMGQPASAIGGKDQDLLF